MLVVVVGGHCTQEGCSLLYCYCYVTWARTRLTTPKGANEAQVAPVYLVVQEEPPGCIPYMYACMYMRAHAWLAKRSVRS